MPDADELLESKLEELESGQPLEKVLSSLPEGMDELEDMIRLAFLLSKLPQPEPSPELAQARRFKVLTSARTTSLARRATKGTLRWIVSSGVLRLTLTVLAVAILVGLGVWVAGPNNARAATLTDLSGQVQVASSAGAGNWHPLVRGEKVYAGQQIRTLADSSATLTFFDGSHTTLQADTTLSLTTLKGRWGGVLQARLTQSSGKTANNIVPLRGSSAFFQVVTPSGEASVHGTQFDVTVDQDGRARFAVTAGTVVVQTNQSQVTLTAGQVTTAKGAQVDLPGYQFDLQGTLTGQRSDLWTVSGVTFKIASNTQITGSPHLGDNVTVTGRILKNNDWVADTVQPAATRGIYATFTGPIVSMDKQAWQVGGQMLQVDDQTIVSTGLQADDPVVVAFVVLEGGEWQALSIQALTENVAVAGQRVTITPAPTAVPSLEFIPPTLTQNGCFTTFTFDGTLKNSTADTRATATGIQLDSLVTAGAQYVEKVTITPNSWASLDPGEQVAFKVQVDLKPEWTLLSDGSTIQVRILIAHQVDNGEKGLTTLDLNIASNCAPTETPTATVQPQPTTETCVGAMPQPEGQALADRYGVSYQEIMGWFCQGFGFGEIDRAYSLSEEYGASVADIFSMRLAGMGWGQIESNLQSQSQNQPQVKPTKTPRPTPENRPTQKPKPDKDTSTNPASAQ